MIGDPVINISNVWKIFGARPEIALQAIREKGLTKAEVLAEYNAVVGVADVSLSVNRGEIFCIMGLSGSGKSTLVRHFNRLLEPTAGKIEIEGTNVMALSPTELQVFRNRKIGMVFQNFALMPHRSVLDNVAMPLEIRQVAKNERMRQAAAILDIVELGPWGSKFAHELSGGMQQRVGLARALAANPDVLLMDEPFSALDPLIRRQLQDEFIRLSKILKKTTVFITHDLDEAPVDAYVADFVAGISRLKVVHAHAVMQPISDYAALHGPLPADCCRVHPGETLSNLITHAIEDAGPILVAEAGQDLGVITRADLLRTVIEGTEVS
ncbi:MAG: ATP-binding cassette domain-containing protein [Alphaproteobacteria bacterium]|nr:ATP-binding cassette domain-containing protein [Alphaproteobacteria bacterium]